MQQKHSADKQHNNIKSLKQENQVLSDQLNEKHIGMLDLMKKNFTLTKQMEVITKEKNIPSVNHYEEYNNIQTC